MLAVQPISLICSQLLAKYDYLLFSDHVLRVSSFWLQFAHNVRGVTAGLNIKYHTANTVIKMH